MATIHNTKTRTAPKSYAVTGTIGKVAQQAWILKQEISALEAKLSPLKDKLTAHFKKMKISRIDSGDAQIQSKTRANWTYSVELQNEMLRIAQMQQREQLEGIAINNETHYIAITTAKK